MLVADTEVSWQRRLGTYRGLVAADEAIVLVALNGSDPVGYAVARLIAEPSDTFAVGDTYAKLYSLSVAPTARGLGIGTRLLDELDALLEVDGINDMVVAVMTDNGAARRFYERRGLRAVETYYWRIGPR